MFNKFYSIYISPYFPIFVIQGEHTHSSSSHRHTFPLTHRFLASSLSIDQHNGLCIDVC